MELIIIRKEQETEEFSIDIAKQIMEDNGSLMDFPELDIFQAA